MKKGGRIKSVVFDKLPLHDTCWSITTGADGKIYAGICGELTGGLSVFLVRYDPEKEKCEYLFEIGPALNEPPDNGRAPQSKIHYCLLPASSGELYCATHCSGPPAGDRIWRSWHTWDDQNRMFSGFHIFSYNPKDEKITDFGVQSPNEGSRAMALAEKRGLLYGITWPRDHFYVYDINKRSYRDMGRIGDINAQSIWIDKDENGYTSDDFGKIVKYDAKESRLMRLKVELPYDISEGPLPRSVYDTVLSPDEKSIYGVTWNLEKSVSPLRLFRYDIYDGDEGRMYDLGPAFGDYKFNHAGGLVFGDDGCLYFAASKPDKNRRIPYRMYLVKMHPDTLKREEVCPIDDGKWQSEYIAKATKDHYGNLYFADTSNRPARIYIYAPEYRKKGKAKSHYLRKWG